MAIAHEDSAAGRLSESRCVALIYLGAVAAVLLTTAARVGAYDEGLILTGALRVLHGEWPSRDFYANYGPAQFGLVAGVFKLLGTSVLAARVWDALTQALTIPVVWLATRCIGSRALRLGAVTLACAALIDRERHLYPIATCTALALAAGVVTARALALRGTWPSYWRVTPLLVAILLYRYDIAAGVGAGLALAVVVVLALQVRGGVSSRSEALRVVALNGALLLAACAAVLALLSWAGILGPALSDLWTYNGANYVQMRSLPFPGMRELIRTPIATLGVYFTPLVLLSALVTFVRRARRPAAADGDRQPGERAITAIVFACIALPFFVKGTVRVGAGSMTPANIAAIVVLAMCADPLREAARWRRWTLAATGILFVWAVGGRMRTSVWISGKPDAAPSPAWLSPFTVEPHRLAAANYLLAHTGPGERILSVNGRHDRAVLNDSVLYFLTQRLPGTRWHQYDPGVQTTAAVQSAMIADLERNGVRWISRDASQDGRIEPNRSAESSGVRLLDDYIASHFREVARFDSITVLERAASER